MLLAFPGNSVTRILTGNSGGRVGEVLCAGGARAVAEERDAAGVAPEGGGVLPDPLQHGRLVHQAVVGHLPARQRRHVRVQET